MTAIRFPFLNRPFVVVALGLAAGIFLAKTFPGTHFFFVLPMLLSGLGIAFSTRFSLRWRNLSILLMFIGAGGALWISRYSGAPGDALARVAINSDPHLEYQLQGRVLRPDIYLAESEYAQFTLQVTSVNEKIPISGRVLIRWKNPEFRLVHGDIVEVVGPLNTSIGRVNPNSAGVEGYYRDHDVHTAMRLNGTESIRKIDSAPWYSFQGHAGRFRNHLAQRLEHVLPKDALPFVLTVWLGDRRSIDDATYSQFMESGTAHILAVSGVHIGIVYASLVFLLQCLFPSSRHKTILIMIAVFLFAFVAGARISSLRAALMIGLYLSAELFDRESDAPSTLGLSAILFLIHRPAVMFDPGFQLSYLSISSLMIFRPIFSEKLTRIPFWLRENLATTLSVQLLPWPIVISQFHVFPIYGIVANLLVIPLLTAVLWLAFLTSSFALLGLSFASIFGQTLGLIISFIMFFTEWIATLPGAIHYFSSPTILATILYWGFFLVVFGLSKSYDVNMRALVLPAILLILVPLSWAPWRTHAEVSFLDVGHGDSVFIQTNDGHRLLIDTGDKNPYYDAGKRDVAPFLWNNHMNYLDGVLLSHSDRDHIGGLEYLIGKIGIGRMYLSHIETDSPLQRRLLEKCQKYNIPVQRVAAGDRISLGTTFVEILYPPSSLPKPVSDNNSSIVCRTTIHGVSFLFSGDIEKETEKSLSEHDIRADVLKVPHHGSTTSSTSEFLAAVDPKIAVISVGLRAGKGSVKNSVLEMYTQNAIDLFRTDMDGGVRFFQKNGTLFPESTRDALNFPIGKKTL